MELSLHDLYQRLSLTKKETEEVVVAPETLQTAVICGGKCQILHFLTMCHYNKMVFKNMMRKTWRLVRGVKFHDLNSTLMLVEFEDHSDKEKVLREGPWSFDKHLVMLKEVNGWQQVHKITLTTATFWVRLHDLPLMARTGVVGCLLGAKVGVVEEVDVDEDDMTWGEYLRVRVSLQVS